MRTFLAVTNLGSVRAAAAHLHVTEPAVSAAVAQLEKHLATELLVRSGRGVQITEAGRIYADYCRTILGLVEESESAVKRAGQGRLRIGAVETASETVLPQLLASFLKRYPEIDLSLSVQPRDELFNELGHHESDVVVAGRPPVGSGLISRASRPNQLIVVAAPGLEPNLASATWLLRGPGSGTRETSVGLFQQLEIAPPTLTLGTHGAVVAAAMEGLGVTLVHADAVQSDLRAGRLVPADAALAPLDRPWHLATTEVPPRSALLFLRHITDPSRVGVLAFHLENRPAG